MSDECDHLREEVKRIRAELDKTPKWAGEPSDEPGTLGPKTKPRANSEYWRLWNELQAATANLHICEAKARPPLPAPAPKPISLRCTRLQSFDNDDIGIIFDTEMDEPYILAFAMDLAAPLNSKLTKIGPIKADDEGEPVTLPPNVIWGLSQAPSIVSSANNFVCIVALMENDDANAETVRLIVEGTLKARVLIELPALLPAPANPNPITRDEFVRRLLSAMDGAIGPASVAFPGPDDQIGTAQEIRLFQDSLTNVYRVDGRVLHYRLRFQNNAARYDVDFELG